MSGDSHLTLDELAELDEGLLAPERELEARNHLDGCADCRARAGAIAEARSALAGLGPAAMPGDVAARIDEALNEAAGSTGSSPSSFDPTAAGNVVPDLSEVRNRRRLPSAPTAAAAGIAILAVVAIVIGFHGNSHDNKTSGISASGSSVQQPLVAVPPSSAASTFTVQSSDRVYRPTTLSAEATTLVRQDAVAGSKTASVAPRPATTSNRNNGLGTSSGGAAGTPAGAGTAPGSAGSTSGGTAHPPKHRRYSEDAPAETSPLTGSAQSALAPALQPYRSQNVVRACAAFITTTNGATPIVADLARWSDPAAGKHNIPAVIMVFPDAENSAKYDVYVVAPPCGNGDLLELLVIDKPR